MSSDKNSAISYPLVMYTSCYAIADEAFEAAYTSLDKNISNSIKVYQKVLENCLQKTKPIPRVEDPDKREPEPYPP